MKNLKPVMLGAGAFLYSLLATSVALADDTEIYVPKDLPADQYVRPNILFVLDSSGSMGSTVSGTGGLSRNQVLKNVVNNLIDEIKVKEDVNVGFMRYNQNTRNDGKDGGGYILSPVQRLTNANAASMKAVVNAIPAGGNTPLLETYYEAYLYMAGKNRLWGAWAPGSVAASRNGETYISPIEHSCQKSHIIYVTDGEPTNDTSSNADVKALVTGKNTLYPASSCGTGQGQCLPHLAEFMANQDLMPAPTPFDDPTGRKQTVTSHFVGFTVNLPLLKNSANAGGGSYYTSNNVSGLTDALKAIIVDITADNTSFAAPSVAVSAFNNLGYRNALYYALFRPAEGARWPGNVKRYKLAEDADGNPLIVDKNGDPAIDDTTGFFSNSSSSFWSSIDGSDVAKGGVAGQLTSPATRKMLTWTAADRTPTASSGVSGSASLENFETGNSGVTGTLLGAATTAERTRYIDWARGYAMNADGSTNYSVSRQSVSDVLHNEPRLIAYTTDEDLARADTASSKEQLYMFFGSNEGFIHAIDPVDGKEKFAFLPKELMSNPGAYYRDAKGSVNKRYGMDGLFNVWTEYGALKADKTRDISKAYLYAGMRRGGSNYYSLDVTSINAPKLKWVIKGPQQTAQSNGTVINATSGFTPGYDKLGLTFSAPKLANININGTKTKVLIFTGGYDLDQDVVGNNTPKADDLGNSLYIADANTGKLLWSASNTGADLNIAEMTHSMPASPTIVDINRDGLADIIFTADLGGQLFRFDIDSDNTSLAGLATGGRIASLGGATAQDNRRFFNSPDVAYIQQRGEKPYFTIAIGSGFREAPLNVDTNDRFYVLRDWDVFTKPASYQTITEDELVDVSGVNLTTAQSTQILADIKVLEDQMKVLNTNLSNAQENFTSYKAGSGYTAKVDSSLSAYTAANDKQRQIDQLTIANGPYLAEHLPESIQQSLLQQALMQARNVLAAIEQARANAQSVADATNAASLATAAASAATALTNAQSAYATAQSLANADAATAASKDSTATTSEAAAATALGAYNTALAAKNAADADLATANTNAANALAAKNSADTALATANAAAASALTTRNNADTAYAAASTSAANALTAKNNADTAYTNASNTAASALATKNAADADLATANTNAASAQTASTNAVTALNAANADVVAKQSAATAAATALTSASNAQATAQTAFNTAEAQLNAAIADVATKQSTLDSANAALAAAQADLDADPGNPALITARNDALAARNAASTALTAAQTTASNKQNTYDTAQATLNAANTNLSSKQAAKDAADAALATSTADAAVALSTKNNADSDLAAANSAAASALTAKNAADAALTAANNDAAAKLATKNAADAALATANANADAKLAARNAAQDALDLANANASGALAAKSAADAALAAANADVTAKQAAQATAGANLTAATNTRNTTAATATADRAAANAAAATAATSATNAANKLAARDAAQAAKNAADLAFANATADDNAAAAMTVQRNRMAANYESLINLQSDLDNANAAILAQENAIIAAKADPGFPSDQIPAMELALATARTDYAALSEHALRAALNTGTPTTATSLLNDVNAALSAGNAAAIAAALSNALAALEGQLGAPAALVGPLAQLLARDEAGKNTALKAKADSEQGASDLIATLTAQRDALTTQADALKAEAQVYETALYVPASGLLTAAQLTAANASGKYSNPLTTFDAYQYLIDLALAAANDPTTGLPALRKQINDKYAQLTPGDTYTANSDLLAAAKGFYLRLVKGEKVLSSSVSFRKAVLFSTFSPRGQAASTCGADVGRGKTYALSLIDASAVFAVSVNGVATPTRSFDLKRSGIPPTPSVILTDNKPVFLTGTETLNDQLPTNGIPGTLVCTQGNEALCESGPTRSTYWRED